MSIIKLKEIENSSENPVYAQLGALLQELEKKTLSDEVVRSINQDIEELNSTSASGSSLEKLAKQKQTNIVKLVEKHHKIVPQNYYRNIWLAVGMSAIGLPIGTLFGLLMGNMALLAIGLPIGMGIGVVVGTNMDKKAAAEGRQLDIELKH
ncbi:hypothetical protein ACI6PS_11255 [Flavobacterium sp. PLA-1-15]|uniref:hypothetical protein n=1 Tax=Flavobacterium sp. PLA-1-15 TaxID=3380533 RepID=UPI003B7B189E